MNDFNKIARENLLKCAKKEKGQLEAMKVIIKSEDDPIMSLCVNGQLSYGFSAAQKETVCKLIDNEIKEINKAINGEPNLWE